MGAYVNPPDQTKESWLSRYPTFVPHPTEKERQALLTRRKEMPVCLVNKGAFSAAAIAYSAEELKVLTEKDDKRPKQWFIVPVEFLLKVSNLSDYYKGDTNENDSSTKPVYFEDENSARIFANGYIEAFRDAGHTVLLINGLVELIVQSKTKED